MVNIDTIREAVQQPSKSKIKNEYIVTFAERESRDTIKSYARNLARAKGEAGLRLDVPEHLKGTHKVLEEHAYSLINLHGKEVKRNIRFDERTENLMMDIKMPQSSRWHNLTARQAIEARKIKEEKDIQAIRLAAANRPTDKERTKALSLDASPGAISRSSTVGSLGTGGTATPLNLVDKGLSMFSTHRGGASGGMEGSDEEVSILREGSEQL